MQPQPQSRSRDGVISIDASSPRPLCDSARAYAGHKVSSQKRWAFYARFVKIFRTEGFQSNPFLRLHFALIYKTHVIFVVLQIVPMKRLIFH